MNTKLYEDLKHCWYMGYKLPKIKEYCNTDYTIDDLQELFMKMWDNELEAYSYKQECDRVLLSRGNNTTNVPSWLLEMQSQQLTADEISQVASKVAASFPTKWLNDLVAEDQAMGLYEGGTL